jgi:EmrB/QacA subfamily drug resistance transporter
MTETIGRPRAAGAPPANNHGATHRGLALLALLLAAFVINLDTTIVNVALPTLVRELRATTTDLQWIVDAYNLAFAALVLAAGSLSDRWGRKGILLAGLGLFGAASLAGSQATTAAELIAARAFMGVGAALIFPSTLSLISNIFTERRERARAIGLWGAMAGVGIALGPIVGGWLLEHFAWGSIFVFLVPVAAVIAGLVAVAVPPSRDPASPRLDWRGLVLSATGMGVLILTVIEAPTWGWGSRAAVIGFGFGVVLMAAFFLVERRTAEPMLDVGLFRNLRFTAASGSVTVSFFALSGFIFLITQYFQFIHGFSPFGTGVRLLPVASSVAVASVLGTRFAVVCGNKLVVTGGLLLFGAGLAWTSTAEQSTAYGVIALQMLVLGTGMGLTSAPATEAIMGVIPRAKAGVGSAVNDATRLFGATLGVAVIGSVADTLYTSRLAVLEPAGLPDRAATAASASVGGALGAARELSAAGVRHTSMLLSDASVSAFLHSLQGGCLLAAGVAGIGALGAGILLPSRPGASATTEPDSDDAIATRLQQAVPAPGGSEQRSR